MGKPAARIGDMRVCPMVTRGILHIQQLGVQIFPSGLPSVMIGGMLAIIMGQLFAKEITIKPSCSTALIGETVADVSVMDAIQVNVILDLQKSMPMQQQFAQLSSMKEAAELGKLMFYNCMNCNECAGK